MSMVNLRLRLRLRFRYFPTRFGLPSHTKTLENKTKKWRHLKTQAYRFTVDGRKWSLLKTH